MTERPTQWAPEGLRRLIGQRPPAAAPGKVCDMCAEPLPPEHGHVVDLEGRGLLCTCRSCFLLFTGEGAAGGRYRAVPDRYRYDRDFSLTDAQWEELQIPVGMAFFFHNSALGRFVAFYPSPAGATESLLPLPTWDEVLRANPEVAGCAPDVEALLVRRLGGGTECFLVPIDACYDLVGRVRLHWRGFHGGEAVWREIDAFFDRLRERSKPLRATGGAGPAGRTGTAGDRSG